MKRKVLVVDDHPSYQRLLLNAARARGFEILDPTQSPNEAIRACSTHKPDVVVLDLHLPGDVDGFELCRLLADLDRHTKVVVSSSFAESDLVDRAFAAGAHRCLRKPFRMDEALRLFEHLAVEFDAPALA